jgi:cytochrome c-type biogenesis protein CcmH
VVTAEARETLAEALKREPGNPRARFFLAIAKEQDGDSQGAVAAFESLLKDAPPGAVWVPAVRQRLQALDGDTARAAIAKLPAADQQAAIRGMVEGLAERLKAGGGTLAEWERLIRSQNVLGEKAAAREAVATARSRLSQDSAALEQLEQLAGELGLKEPAP